MMYNIKVSNMQVWRNWQTRTVQVRMRAISCRFKSCYLHHVEAKFALLRLFLCKKVIRPLPCFSSFTKKSHLSTKTNVTFLNNVDIINDDAVADDVCLQAHRSKHRIIASVASNIIVRSITSCCYRQYIIENI